MDIVHEWYRDAYRALQDYRYHVAELLESPKEKKKGITVLYVNNKKLKEFQKVIDKAEEFFTNPKETK